MMKLKRPRFKLGLRTLKTAVAVIISMIIVDSYGATSSKLIFAMLGAMAAVQPTFKDSLESCLTQIVGTILGALFGIALLALPVSHFLATGIGIMAVITFYTSFQIRHSPSLSCFIVVLLCTTPDIEPVSYALGRIWDTAIGLSVGMLINTMIFPYDNSRQIRATAESVNHDVIRLLEELFDGDDISPDTDVLLNRLETMQRQLVLFSNQKFFLHPVRRRQELEALKLCEVKTRELFARMQILCCAGRPGRLSDENRKRLAACGAVILDQRPLDSVLEKDVVTNYHVSQILTLRHDILEILNAKKR